MNEEIEKILVDTIGVYYSTNDGKYHSGVYDDAVVQVEEAIERIEKLYEGR